MIDNENLIYACGMTYHIINILKKEVTVYFSRDGGGIGAIGLHPSKKYFAIAEKGTFPNIYIYDYPNLKLYRILRKGTEKSYSSVNFSFNGNSVASVGSFPDYTLAIWNWK